MPLKPLLTALALTLAVAGCSTLPPSAGIDRAQTAPAVASPRVTLDVQGLAKATITASTLTQDPEEFFWIPNDTLHALLAYLVEKDAPLPADAKDLTWLEHVSSGTPYRIVGSETEATHRLYRLPMLSEAKLALLKASFPNGSEPNVEAPLKLLPDGSLAILNPQPEALNSVPVLTLAEDAPEALCFVKKEYPWIANGYEVLPTWTWDGEGVVRRARLELALNLETNSGNPLLGLKKEAFELLDVRYTPANSNDSTAVYESERFVTLKELGEGRYTLSIDLLIPAGVPDLQEVSVELSLRNVPQFRDVEY